MRKMKGSRMDLARGKDAYDKFFNAASDTEKHLLRVGESTDDIRDLRRMRKAEGGTT